MVRRCSIGDEAHSETRSVPAFFYKTPGRRWSFLATLCRDFFATTKKLTRTYERNDCLPSCCSDEEWSDDEKAEDAKGGGAKDDLEELDEKQLGELLAREQRARHIGLSQVPYGS